MIWVGISKKDNRNNFCHGILFVKDKRYPQTDLEFIQAIANSGNVVNALYFEQEEIESVNLKIVDQLSETGFGYSIV